ncbi:MAG: SIMPL domain-containing protein [Floccifex sp.]
MGTIKTIGYAKKEYEANLGNYVFHFRYYDSKNEESIKGLNQKVEYYLNVLQQKGFQISDFRLEKDVIQSFEQIEEKNVYVSSKEITYETKPSAALFNTFMEIAQTNEIDVKITVDYQLVNTDSYHEQLLIEAMNQARHRAEIIASSQNMKVTGMDPVRFDSWESDESCSKDDLCMSVQGIELDTDSLSDSLSLPLILQEETV